MPTNWVVTTPSDHVELDEAQQGQTTFTVTNPTKRVDRVVLDVVPGDGADASWFSVDEPQRRVPASGSVSYLMKTAVPTDAKPGSYSVQARVYSADSAPEEDSVLSSRLVVEIKAKAAPVVVKKKIPWWVFVVIALVVIVAAVVWIIAANSGGTPNTTPSTGPTGTVTMPDLNKQSEAQARTNLTAFGLTVGTVKHKFDANNADQVLYQSVPGGSVVAKGTPIDLVVTVAPALPQIKALTGAVPAASLRPQATPVPVTPTAPASGSPAPTSPKPSASPSASATAPAVPTGVLNWTEPQDFVHHWVVYINEQFCTVTFIGPFTGVVNRYCYFHAMSQTLVDQPAFTPLINWPQHFPLPGGGTDAQPIFQWTVAPIDDFGNVGPAAGPSPLQVQ